MLVKTKPLLQRSAVVQVGSHSTINQGDGELKLMRDQCSNRIRGREVGART